MSFALVGALPAVGVVSRHDAPDDALAELAEGFKFVGRVAPDGACTLIAPDWVVTAAHVAAQLSTKRGTVHFGEEEYGVSRVVIHPKGNLQPDRPPEVDLALVRLDRKVAGITPVALYGDRDELGRVGVIAGGGDVGDGRSVPRRSDGRLRAVKNVIDDAGPMRLFINFDEPPGGIELEGVGGPGDSGGPLLMEKEGQFYLAGVSSGSFGAPPGRYGVTDVYMRVSSFLDWIREAMDHQQGNTKGSTD
jgi:hypothetical protein